MHVDDDQPFQEITKLMLLDLNSCFEIDQAFCVDEGLKKLSVSSYDVVVSDYEMPQKDGLEFLKELRVKNNSIPFILFTGKGREEVAIKALNLGADGYYNKLGSPRTVFGELAHGIQQSVTARRNEQSREIQFRILSDFSTKINLAETLKEICVLICSKIKECIGQGYVVVTLIDEAEQFEYIIATDGFNDKGIVNSAIRLLGGDPRESVYAVKDMLPEELEQFRSGKLERITGGLYALMARRQPKTVCRIIERLMGANYVYAVGFVHKNRYLGGAEIMLNSQTEIQKNKSLIEALMGQTSPVISRFYSEQKLLESEQRHRVISNLMADVKFSYIKPEGDNFAIDWIAGAAEKVLGCSVEEITKRGSWKFVVAPQDFPIFDEKVLGLNSGQSSTCELKIIQADGATRWIRVFSHVEKDKANPKIHRLFGAVEDISGRKKVEETLEKSKKKYQLVFENNFDGIIVGKRDGTILSVNTAICLMLRMKEHEIIKAGRQGIIVDEPRNNAALNEQDKYGQVVARLTFRRKDGSTFEAEISSKEFVDVDGSNSLLVTVHDMSNRLVLEEKLRTIGSFTRHDINNKLMSAKAQLFLAEKLIKDQPEIQNRYEKIEAALTGIDRILQVSKQYETIGSQKLRGY